MIPLTPEEFKAKFKVGDVVTCWSTGLQVTITAIGETRILAWDEQGGRKREAVSSMKQCWRLIYRGTDVGTKETEIQS